MRLTASLAILLVANYTISTGAIAQNTTQNTYKCGNNYSQTPCPGGTLVDTQDSRSAEQKKQTDSATKSNTKTADKLARERLAQEKKDLAGTQGSAATVITGIAPPKDAPVPVAKSKTKKKKKEPEYFTASPPGETRAAKTKRLKEEKAAKAAAAAK